MSEEIASAQLAILRDAGFCKSIHLINFHFSKSDAWANISFFNHKKKEKKEEKMHAVNLPAVCVLQDKDVFA